MKLSSSFYVNGVYSESSLAPDVANLTNMNAIAMLKGDLNPLMRNG